jgi:ParB-like chromosome segregation protein Spo0J
MEKGGYRSQTDLARKKGVSRARVTQILNLLKLDEEVQEMVVGFWGSDAVGWCD